MSTTSAQGWDELKERLGELRDLAGATSVLTWDQETMMPPAGVHARSGQLATLQGLAHERLTAPALGELVEKLAGEPGLDDTRAALLRAVRFDRDRAVRIPPRLVRALAERQSLAVEAWKAAREANDFPKFAPHLRELVRLRREMADAYGIPEGGERYDALLEGYEEGMRVARLEPLFANLRAWLVPLVAAVTARPAPRTDFLKRRYEPDRQWRFTEQLLDAMGFELRQGRLDRSAHPFTIGIDPGDVRLTTRILEELPMSAIFATIHEAGHGLYEQGLPAEHRRNPLCAAPSMGIHESQSRLWENLVGRSRPFWEHFLPRLRSIFPEELAGVTLDDFLRAVNRVERSLIRVEADEVTYNLHILVRFDLELGLMRGGLEVDDLPSAWNDRMERFLGLRPGTDREGVLQDIHWAWGEFGYFPTYTIGNLYAATLFNAAKRALPGLEEQLRDGRLTALREWLRDRVHHVGRTKKAEDIVVAAAGHGLDDADFRAYLTGKYEELYGVTA